jgi:hypothetical protein
VSSSLSAASGRQSRPEALIRGASRKPIDCSSQSRLLGLGDAPQPEQRERAVLVDQRDDVRDRRKRDDVEVPFEERMLGPEQRLRELPDDGGAAEALERIVALQRRDDRARRERLGRAMVIGDDHFQPE